VLIAIQAKLLNLNEMTEEQPLDKTPIDFNDNRFLSAGASSSGNKNDSKTKQLISFKHEIYHG